MTCYKTILSLAAIGSLRIWKNACAVLLLCAATAIAAPAQTFRTVVNFDGTTIGQWPYGLVQGTDGNFYGATEGAEIYTCSGDSVLSCGTVFNTTADGTLTTLFNFPADGNTFPYGSFPSGGMTLGTDGSFFGTTLGGPTGTNGTVFNIAPEGSLTSLFAFSGKDGTYPYGVIQRSDGGFYGTTYYGGKGQDGGTFYGLALRGAVYVEKVLYSFCSQTDCADGSQPLPGLLRASDGNFYGITAYGGYKGGECAPQGCGTIFKLTPGGTLTTLYTFCQAQDTCGADPAWQLIQASNGKLYGVTVLGGNTACGNSGTSGCGTIFEISTDGTFKTLYMFCSRKNCADGMSPWSVIQANDGNLYGINYGPNSGQLFEITLAGKLTIISQAPGLALTPYAPLIQSTDGTFYGTSLTGGAYYNSFNCPEGCGYIFNFATGLPSFVKTQPTIGIVANPVIILGNNLTGSTSVTFNGVAANFTVVSDTEITTTVPTGATTGSVQVTTPSGTLTSNLPFRVRQ